MDAALEKARRRIHKIVIFLRHNRPKNDAHMEDIQRWARAADAAGIIERYLDNVGTS
ncbi:MAG: hypothetical protein AAGL98_00230 [Planctomycetota bacterium]